jgi:hypothetical protein
MPVQQAFFENGFRGAARDFRARFQRRERAELHGDPKVEMHDRRTQVYPARQAAKKRVIPGAIRIVRVDCA